jgi:hypothetical protein
MLSLLLSGLLLLFVFTGCSESTPHISTSSPVVDQEKLHLQVVSFCGNCHAYPSPESFPRDAWFNEVQRGFKFYDESGRNDLQRPRLVDVVDFYRSRAPEQLPLNETLFTADSRLEFRKTAWRSKSAGDSPMVSSLTIRTRPSLPTKSVIVADMHTGEINELIPGSEVCESRLLARLRHPARTISCDLDSDGREDLLVAELGSQLPSDNKVGEVVWIRSIDSDVPETPIIIAKGLGRVADVAILDSDGDRDLDIVVSVFGWQRTGEIILLEQNHSEDRSRTPEFTARVIDGRHGTIQTIVEDMNGDGASDLLSLISQEHEQIVLFPGQREGKFNPGQVIFDAKEPAFGSSSMGLTDLDLDDDLDFIYTNGDTLDSYYIKPYHGVHWLENQGAMPFKQHRLVAFPGATCVVPGDFDGDGDLDLVAGGFLPKILKTQLPQNSYPTLLWLQQDQGQFIPRQLEASEVGHMVLLSDDLDHDGDPDLVIGHYIDGASPETPSVSVWWNQTPKTNQE